MFRLFRLPRNPIVAILAVLFWWPLALAFTFAWMCLLPFWLILRAI